MKLLITGAAGQLGTELQRQLQLGGSSLGAIPAELQHAEAVAVDLADADLSSLDEARALVQMHRPDAILNCAAFTNVDACETQRDAAFGANAVAPRNLAIAAEELGAKLVHVSTDYVLEGVGESPVPETALPNPQSVYGATKLLGEQYVRDFCSRWFILRTAWLYGVKGGNFVKAILRRAQGAGECTVVNDQLGNPTSAEDLAHHMLKLVVTQHYGLYHCTCEDTCSWYDFAAEIVRLSGIPAVVKPCSTEEYIQNAGGRQIAPRPAYSSLDNAMLRATVGNGMRPWQQALEDYMRENTLEDLLA